MCDKNEQKRLLLWRERMEAAERGWASESGKMDQREELYLGGREILPVAGGNQRGGVTRASHVWNIVSELIETQVDSTVPQPKVTARRPQDEDKARLIEDMLRGELDRLHFEVMNDQMERTVPIQGGALFLCEWDDSLRSAHSDGELCVTALHPKQFIPQDGVFSGIGDMDYFFLKLPQTREYILRRYGKDVSEEGEPQSGQAEDVVTQYVAYYKNDAGGVGRFSWVGEVVLEDENDYQARREKRCSSCGAVWTGRLLPSEPTADGERPPITGEKPEPDRCPYCGGSGFKVEEAELEELFRDVRDENGLIRVEGAHFVTGSDGGVSLVPRLLPAYKPGIYPVILQKNVSVFGRVLGDSDVDKIADLQNTIKRLSSKINDKLLKSGSYISLPRDATVESSQEELKIIRPNSPADMSMIGVYNMEADVQADVQYQEIVYEQGRRVIGITDSFQGRRDSTAISGVAKEFSAAQTEGRLESKRVMKYAAYADLFRAMFRFKLAYADRHRPVVSRDEKGRAVYRVFDRYDFLEYGDDGELYWNDDFLFSCDTVAPLAANRQAMWQETLAYFQSGAFGDPRELATLITFWTKMEMLHYPGAGDTLSFLRAQA